MFMAVLQVLIILDIYKITKIYQKRFLTEKVKKIL